MSNVIAFLESMGKNATTAFQSEQEYASTVNQLELDNVPRQALLNRDHTELAGLLGGRLQMMCILFPADGDDNKKDDQQDGESPGQDDQDDQQASIGRNGRH